MATATFADMAQLQTDATLKGRISAAVFVYCTSGLPGESITNATAQAHIRRQQYASQILNNPSQYDPLFQQAVCCNQTVANDATAGGTLVGMTPTQIATAAAGCTDTDISNAVASAFNAFIGGI